MRHHVDASFEDFESAPQTTTKKSFKEDAGSFWDDNQGDDWDEKPSAKGKKNDGIDSLLDNIGGLLVEGAESVRSFGNSLWSGFTSLLGDDFAMNVHYTIGGKEYTAKVVERGENEA